MRACLLGAVALILACVNAHADDYENCRQHGDISLRFTSCWKVLENGDEPGEHKAIAHVGLCKMFADRANLELARPHCIKAIVQTSFAENFVNLGSAEFENGHYTEALEHFQKAVDMQPDLGEAQTNLRIAEKKLETIRSGPVADAVTLSQNPRH